MQAGQRDLGGAGEEELVLGDLVDLVAVAGQEAGPLQRLFADQDRRDHRLVALGRGPARSRSGPGPARAAPGRPSGRRSASRRAAPPASMSIRPSSVPISRWSRGSKSNSGGSPTSRRTTASSSVIPSGASGSGRLGSASGELARARPRPAPARPCRTRSVSFSPCTVGHQLLGVLARLLGLADLLGERLALGLGALDLGQQLAAAGVEGQQLVDLLGGAAARQRRLDPLGVGADQLQVEHGALRARARSRRGAASIRLRRRRTWRRSGRPLRPRRRRRCSGA